MSESASEPATGNHVNVVFTFIGAWVILLGVLVMIASNRSTARLDAICAAVQCVEARP